MNRRHFFQSIAALTASIGLPLPALALPGPRLAPKTADELRQWFKGAFTLKGSILGPGLVGDPPAPPTEPMGWILHPRPQQKITLAAVTWKCGVRVLVPDEKWQDVRSVEGAVAEAEPKLVQYAYETFLRTLAEQPRATGSGFWWRVVPHIASAGRFAYWEHSPSTIHHEWFDFELERAFTIVPVVLRFRAAFEGLKLGSMEGQPPLPATL